WPPCRVPIGRLRSVTSPTTTAQVPRSVGGSKMAANGMEVEPAGERVKRRVRVSTPLGDSGRRVEVVERTDEEEL
ncbi:hypothetical protein chiPu_0025254, partial [Chiloscyllium punctatum]|nr:hypothetical protein [Chiloscyllium punctatum]